jgi:hypothetical protein
MAEYTKRQMSNHIQDLFAQRPETSGPRRWGCIIRDGELMITLPPVIPTDLVITECWLEPGRSPSWLLIYYDVDKKWDVLRTADITEFSIGGRDYIYYAISKAGNLRFRPGWQYWLR